ncbi:MULTISPECIES: DUF5085 family protein [Bacillaceae]|uniref:DUF5085 family protein n=1 Tax=Bacillaceae TaxID=186817 RepID=UPI0006F9A53A|nr:MULTISPECIES: DUF5085 family protein [Bacillaceae]KQL36827.1 lactoylglutathione lyase [Psychrobacillus sp. FJAT-21963]MDF2065907.1 DUF5085 family protein [Bacillus sp. Cr_A10]
MIAENHQIAYRNVASKLYNFLPEEIDIALKDFDTILTDHGYHPTGPIFFTIISDPTSEVMTAELFLPIAESQFSIPKEEEVNFRSYFYVNNLLSTRIINDFDVQSQVKYWELFDYMKEHNMTQKTPVFVQFKKTNSNRTYAEMSLGVL